MGRVTSSARSFGWVVMVAALVGCGKVHDHDDDGFGEDVDCDDRDPSVHPDQPEVVDDGIDNDCDAAVDCDDTELTWSWLGDVTDTDVAGFCDGACAVTVAGDVSLDGTALTNLDDLSCVTAVEGSVYVRGNPELTSVDGLANLESVGRDLILGEYWCTFDYYAYDFVCTANGNPSLTTLPDFASLERVGGLLWIAGNESLTEGGSFSALTSVGTDVSAGPPAVLWHPVPASPEGLWLEGNPTLVEAPSFPVLTSVTSLSLWENDALTSLAGLSALSEVGGHVVVVGNSALESLAGLDKLETIGGNLLLRSTALTSLTGLGNLRSVGLTLQVEDNDALVSMDALTSLASVGQSDDPVFGSEELVDGTPGWWWRAVLVYENEVLEDLRGLDQLTGIRDCLCVWTNPSLTSLEGVGNLVETGGLNLQSNPGLTSLEGLASLERVNYEIQLIDMGGLTSLEGLEQVTSVGWFVFVLSNAQLATLSGLDGLVSVPDFVEIRDNPALTDLSGLGSLTSIGSHLAVDSNPSLVDLSGLGSLTSVGGILEISDNASLESLSGLESLTHVGDDLALGWFAYYDEPWGNPSLTDVTALYGLQSVTGDVFVTANTSLGDVAAQALVDEIESIGGQTWVAENHP